MRTGGHASLERREFHRNAVIPAKKKRIFKILKWEKTVLDSLPCSLVDGLCLGAVGLTPNLPTPHPSLHYLLCFVGTTVLTISEVEMGKETRIAVERFFGHGSCKC